jgi:hypothetical protein
MIKKKGEFLTKEGLELLLAVIAIILVVYVVGALWNIFVNSEEQNAKKTANLIEAKINALGEGQGNIFLVQGFSGSENWFITGWSTKEPNRPDACYFDSCICVCRKLTGVAAITRIDESSYATLCKEKGFCRIFKSADNIKVSEIRFEGNKVSYILLKGNILDINITKIGKDIYLSRDNTLLGNGEKTLSTAEQKQALSSV